MAALAILASALAGPARAEQRDFTFFMSSDPHVGSEDKKAKPPVTAAQAAKRIRQNVDKMLATIGQPYPKVGPLSDLPDATVAMPRGLLIAGDLTDNGAWPMFTSIFAPARLQNGKVPLFVAAGNHDGAPQGATRKGILEANRQHQKRGRLSAISDNGFHYAMNWQGVHIICVNLCPADTTDPEKPFIHGKPGKGSWNDPLGALRFLQAYLEKNVGKSGAPVIIWQHYGYCEVFNVEWLWWSPAQRRAFYEVARQYNIVALLHGHTHAPAHYRWPDPKADPEEMKRLFDGKPPEDLRSFDVFSAGSVGGGTFYVFRILDDQFIAAHHGPDGWTEDAHMHIRKPLMAAGGQAKAEPAPAPAPAPAPSPAPAVTTPGAPATH